MRMQTFFAATLLVSFATPTFADEYYVVQDLKSKRCSVVDKQPTNTTTATQVGTVTFNSRTEAEAAMQKEKICLTR